MSTLGYTVTETMQGRGVATAAVREAIRIAFGPLGLERIEAVAAVENVASRRVLEKAASSSKESGADCCGYRASA